ncbi:MAG: hypothetical protein RIG77_26770 [Cyclobacteriaceae bacterium]
MKYYLITQISFVALTIICLALFYLGIRSGLRNYPPHKRQKFLLKFTSITLIWIAVLSMLSLTGFVADFSNFPPRLMLVLLPPAVALVFITKSPATQEILTHLAPDNLVYLQSFRIIVEVLLWMLFLDNLTPIQMTFEGRNFDILVGITALVAAPIFFGKAKLQKNWGIGWNIFGLLLLANILVIAILSFPSPIRYFMNEPANTQVAKFPIIFLPGILVPIAYYLHVLSIKQLLLRSNR